MKRISFLWIASVVVLVLAGCAGNAGEPPAPSAAPVTVSSVQTAQPAPTAEPAPTVEPAPSAEPEPERYSAIPLPQEMRAMWISFLEWQQLDLSTEGSMREGTRQMFQNCKGMGLNTVIVSVHPFMDAMYPSAYFPWSHLVTGEQGKDPGYDPLAVMTEEAHAAGLRVEAWLNPYRVQHPEHGPAALSEDSPAAAHPEWVRERYGLWLDPGIPEVKQLAIDGVTEVVEHYDVDGIHFDDYFYPEGNTAEFDAQTYAEYGGGRELADWRRENINEMARGVYQAVKAANPTVSFGVSPQGNNKNNYTEQYCDIELWMAQPGYADYIMPQLYWGFNYSRDGDAGAAFANKVAEWADYERNGEVKLYAGLGAYRIGEGDGGEGSQDEWRSGHNLADMVSYLRGAEGFGGFALFHYSDLFPIGENAPYPELSQSEVLALAAALGGA